MATAIDAALPAGCRKRLALALLSTACVPALAQTVRLVPEVQTSLTLTSNAAYTTTGAARADAVLSVAPRLTVMRQGGSVSLEGTIGAEAVYYARQTQPSVVRPRGGLNLRSELVERWLHFDASLNADRVVANPYAAQPQAASSFNDYTALTLRLTPYLQRALTPTLDLLARSDHVLSTRVGGGSASDPGGATPDRDAHVQEQLIQLEQRPTPLGWSAELRRQDTSYRSESAAVLRQTSLRLGITYELTQGLDLGVVAGRENSEYSLQDRNDNVTGLRLRWRPTDRSELRASVERRFFGTGVDIEVRHRTPWFSLSARIDRQPVAQAGTHLLGQAGGDVAALLDGMLTTRHADPAARQLAVQNLMREFQLPGTLVRPMELFTSYAQLQQEVSATALFQGRLSSVSLTLYVRRRERLVNVDDALAPAAITSDNEQRGVEINASHRVAPLTTLTGALRHTRIAGLAAASDRLTQDTALSIGVSQALAPNSRVSFVLRHQRVSAAGAAPARETAMTMMLSHRF